MPLHTDERHSREVHTVTFQQEHKAWVDALYPRQPVYIPAAGLVEEAGELLHAILKKEQANLWGEEPRYQGVNWNEKIKDAIGDCGIYVCSLCNAHGNWDYIEIWRSAQSQVNAGVTSPLNRAARLVALGVKVIETPSIKYSLIEYTAQLMRVAASLGLATEECVLYTWERVKERKR